MYSYFVSYCYTKNDSDGKACTVVPFPRKIKRMGDILLLAKGLKDVYKYETVVIYNFIKL